jgi:outer membrane protein assembly factor BamA
MFLPILDAEDGYGLTYGARFALVGAAGPRSRVSFPLTWGGTKRAAVELDRPLSTGPFSRVEAGAAIQKQTNPAFDEDDERRRVWARVERTTGPVRLGGSADWQHVSFGGLEDSVRSVGADATIDTRLDPVLPRNAVYASAGWSHVNFASGRGVDRTDVDARAYIGLKGAPVLVVRVAWQGADQALPDYLKPLLGGWSSLRGFAAGAFVGDTVADGSVELRVPLTSPLHVARAGVSVFVDAGEAYDVTERFGDRPLERGTGASVWVAATALHLEIAVAHGYGHGTRVNFGAGLTF